MDYLSVNKPTHLKSIIIEQCVGILPSSALIRTSTCEFMDKTPQIAGEQLVMTMDKTQETKLQRYQVSVLMFSADISKSEEISRCE